LFVFGFELFFFPIIRSVARFLLVIVMVLIPLGGLNSFMTPIIQLIVGAIVMLALVVIDWAFNVALGPPIPENVEMRVVQIKAGPEIQALQQRIAQQDAEIVLLKQQLANKAVEAPVVVVSPRVVSRAPPGDCFGKIAFLLFVLTTKTFSFFLF
jgi:hypothetical protein